MTPIITDFDDAVRAVQRLNELLMPDPFALTAEQIAEACDIQQAIYEWDQERRKLHQSKPKLYTLDDVYEILRQVMFTGTPELYDQGGMHGSMKPTDTLKRAKEAFARHYLKQTTQHEQ